MSPAPSVNHQRISGDLFVSIYNQLQNQPCQLFSAPFDVRLYNRKKSMKANEEIYSVVQPDICLVCDQSKLDKQGCNGAPELVIEILSPGNSQREMDDKFELYQEAGVQEYWLVEPSQGAVFVYVLNEEKYIGLKPATKHLVSPGFHDLAIDLGKIFGS